MNIVLCGLPKCGKTTIGKLLAKKLKRPFIDTDQLMGGKQRCREIFLEKGEATFRALEEKTIATLLTTDNAVISLGGGAPLTLAGTLIYLKVDLDLLAKRQDPKAAFLQHETFYDLAKRRIPLYEAAASATVDITHLKNEAAVEAILVVINDMNR